MILVSFFKRFFTFPGKKYQVFEDFSRFLEERNMDKILEILDNIENINIRDKEGRSFLHLACLNADNYFSVSSYVFEKCNKILNPFSNFKKIESIIPLLIERGINLELKDNKGMRAIDYALRSPKQSLYAIFEHYGKLIIAEAQGVLQHYDELSEACKNNKLNIINELNRRDKNGNNLLLQVFLNPYVKKCLEYCPGNEFGEFLRFLELRIIEKHPTFQKKILEMQSHENLCKYIKLSRLRPIDEQLCLEITESEVERCKLTEKIKSHLITDTIEKLIGKYIELEGDITLENKESLALFQIIDETLKTYKDIQKNMPNKYRNYLRILKILDLRSHGRGDLDIFHLCIESKRGDILKVFRTDDSFYKTRYVKKCEKSPMYKVAYFMMTTFTSWQPEKLKSCEIGVIDVYVKSRFHIAHRLKHPDLLKETFFKIKSSSRDHLVNCLMMKTGYGENLFHFAGDLGYFSFFLEEAKKFGLLKTLINERNNSNETPLDVVIASDMDEGDQLEIVKLMINNGANAFECSILELGDNKINLGNSFEKAVITEKWKIVKFLLERLKDKNQLVNSFGDTVFHILARSRSLLPTSIYKLINDNADPGVLNQQGLGYLQLASSLGNTHFIQAIEHLSKPRVTHDDSYKMLPFVSNLVIHHNQNYAGNSNCYFKSGLVRPYYKSS